MSGQNRPVKPDKRTYLSTEPSEAEVEAAARAYEQGDGHPIPDDVWALIKEHHKVEYSGMLRDARRALLAAERIRTLAIKDTPE